jgi:FkbM family methyltransferase
MLRARLGALLPVAVRRRLRPVVMPVLYRLEQPRMEWLYARLVGPGDTAFDIGAAEGYHTEVLAGLGARVVAVEPRPEAVAVLRRRFAGQEAVTVVEAGVGATRGTRQLHLCDGDPELSTFAVDGWRRHRYRGRRWDPAGEVPMTTVADLAARHGRPRFVKVDVEGLEAEVLAGLDALPETLSFEFVAGQSTAVRACVARLAALGPVGFDLSLFRRYRLHHGQWLDGERLVTVVEALPLSACGDVYARRS